jgi:EpsI family protein
MAELRAGHEQDGDGAAGQPLFARRNLLLGGLLLAGAGVAWARLPRQSEMRLGDAQLEDLVPERIGDWRFLQKSGLVLPPQDELRDLVYSQLLTRVYVRGDDAVMLLIAYSAAQDGVIQVHRPEVCYPASGYRIIDNRPSDVPLAPGLSIPSRAILAQSESRSERLIYWTRVGEYFPDDWADQRIAVARENLEGVIPDGVLVRISEAGAGTTPGTVESFAKQLYASVPPRMRQVLAGRG